MSMTAKVTVDKGTTEQNNTGLLCSQMGQCYRFLVQISSGIFHSIILHIYFNNINYINKISLIS